MGQERGPGRRGGGGGGRAGEGTVMWRLWSASEGRGANDGFKREEVYNNKRNDKYKEEEVEERY